MMPAVMRGYTNHPKKLKMKTGDDVAIVGYHFLKFDLRVAPELQPC